MNLIIDIGNTLVKFGVFQNNSLLQKVNCNHYNIQKCTKQLLKQFHNITKIIVSSVGNIELDINKELIADITIHHLNHKTRLPFNSKYVTPNTLGVDRMALVSAAVQKFPNKNVLIVDAGTCITYDFLTNKNDYLGGAISPGIRMRYKSLNSFTAKLPLLETQLPKSLIGDSSNESIHSGVVFGVIEEINGVINLYKEKYPDLTVILTGGDAKFLSDQLKNGIFAHSNFLLEGLNYILEYNTTE